MDRYLDRIRTWLDVAAQALWSYVLGLTPDEIELYFLGLFAVGCLLSIWLLYAIHRRGQVVRDADLAADRGREVGLPQFTDPTRQASREAAEAERAAAPAPLDAAGPRPRAAARRAPAEIAAPREAPAARPERAPARPPAAAPPAPAAAPPAATPEGLFARLRGGLAATRNALVERLDGLVGGRATVDEGMVAGLEEILISSDVGVRTTGVLLTGVRGGLRSGKIRTPDDLRAALEERMTAMLAIDGPPAPAVTQPPRVILVVGVNGTGKTTSIGKLARRFQSEGKKVMLGAADTFRAAAIEQLEIWGERSGIPVIRQGEGADPGAVAYDALQAAKARGMDVLIVDTAGRMHTKKNLMDEIRKVKRVLGKDHPGAPHEVLLVLDATTGQNAISQAHLFHEALELSGLVVTKLDGTAKGGVILGICDELKVPVRYIGIGEAIEDLRPFNAREFVEALFGRG